MRIKIRACQTRVRTARFAFQREDHPAVTEVARLRSCVSVFKDSRDNSVSHATLARPARARTEDNASLKETRSHVSVRLYLWDPHAVFKN